MDARRDSFPLSRSRPRSLATLVTPTTSTPVRDNISLISLLCSILHQPIWAGTRSNKFTGRLTVLAGPKRRQLDMDEFLALPPPPLLKTNATAPIYRSSTSSLQEDDTNEDIVAHQD
jgi:hypothetical protein